MDNRRTETARENDDSDILDRAEPAPSQGGTSGGNLQEDIATQAELERVRDPDHPCELGDLVSGQPQRVAAAVDPFVVVHDPGERLVQEPDLPHDLQPAHGVQLDGGVLLVGQRPVLGEDLGGDAELADVVQHAGVAQGLHALRAHPQLPGDHHRGARNPGAMPARERVLGLHRLAQRRQRRVVGLPLRERLLHRPPGHQQRQQHQQCHQRAEPSP